MNKFRALTAFLGLWVAVSAGGCVPYFLGGAPVPIPVPPWVAERMEEKYDPVNKNRAPIMPPILPGMNPVLCMDPPSDAEIIRTLPRVAKGIPFVYEEFRDDFNIVVELLVDKIDPVTFVPLIGPAQLHHCHYRCTVHYKERIQSMHPFPFQVERDRVEVLLIDKNHYHLAVGNDQAAQRSITRDLSGP